VVPLVETVNVVGVFVVVDEQIYLFPFDDGRDLRACEVVVEQYDPDATFGCGEQRVQQSAMVTAHDADGVFGAEALCPPGVGDGIGTRVDFVVGQGTAFVDQSGTVTVP